VTGPADPAEEADDPAIEAASAAACGAGTTEPSPAASEINAAAMTRHRSFARRAVVVQADMAYRPLIAAQATWMAVLLSVMLRYAL
jgi:hypothetical protein